MSIELTLENYVGWMQSVAHVLDETSHLLAELSNTSGLTKFAEEIDRASNLTADATIPPRVVVFGFEENAKSTLVNDLLSLPLLPNDFEPFTKRRSVLIVPTLFSSDYSLIEGDKLVSEHLQPGASGAHDRGDVPQAAVRQVEQFGPEFGDGKRALYKVWECHLAAAAHPTYSYFALRWLQWVAMRSVPLMVYVLKGPKLNTQEANDLKMLRQFIPNYPVFFVRADTYNSGDDVPPLERYINAWLSRQCQSPGGPNGDLYTPSGNGNGFMSPNSGSEYGGASSAASSDTDSDAGYLSPAERGVQMGRDSTHAKNGHFFWPRRASGRPQLGQNRHNNLPDSVSTELRQSLRKLGYDNFLPLNEKHAARSRHHKRELVKTEKDGENDIMEGETLSCDLIDNRWQIGRLALFSEQILQRRSISLSADLNRRHCDLLNSCIVAAYDMARDQIITPKRIAFARETEERLYAELTEQLEIDRQRIEQLCVDELESLRDTIAQEAAEFTFSGGLSSVSNYAPSTSEAEHQLQQFILFRVNACITGKLNDTLQCLRHTFIGTLTRCLESLETPVSPGRDESTLDEMTNVRNGTSGGEVGLASRSLNELLESCYRLDLQLPMAYSSLMRTLWLRLKQALKIGNSGASGCCQTTANTASHTPLTQSLARYNSVETLTEASDAQWRRKVANDTINRLITCNIGRHLCAQLKQRIDKAHTAFRDAISALDTAHVCRLASAENRRLKLRRTDAPRLARLTMESMALRDSLLYGMPKLGAELGRGQYGVVYASDSWAARKPCAVKSVVPPDDKHWNDLALEFYYTKSLPEHERVVRLYGAVIDHNYAGGTGPPAVLLIMERMRRDLYAALQAGLSWPARLQVALDVLDGIRFLHSQGLVHRDIKLKNVLLDDWNRAKLTDLGFCKPEAMMSGSVVGTPIHMAPELFSGAYDASVDVYICSGSVTLPQAFARCPSKDFLWQSVRKGLRPEQLSSFDKECWALMRSCWEGDPAQRPHLGDMLPRLNALLDQCVAEERAAGRNRPASNSAHHGNFSGLRFGHFRRPAARAALTQPPVLYEEK